MPKDESQLREVIEQAFSIGFFNAQLPEERRLYSNASDYVDDLWNKVEAML